LPFLPATNLFLFIAYGVPLTGSTHYNPRLGVLSSTVLLVTARATQILFGLAPYTQEFLVLAGVWGVTQIFLIGYLPGKIIPTSENLGYLFKGLAKVAMIYAGAEYVIWAVGRGLLFSSTTLLVFPLLSIPLLVIVSTLTTFLFTNTFCPYMMMPLISSAVKGQRYCGAGNFVFKLGGPVAIDETKIKKAQKKGFRLVSKLPSVTVFSCPLGGVISVYHSGDMLIRKVNKGTAERINRHLSSIVVEQSRSE
ncbi:MAG: hypothetical protein ACE5HH_04170, partial [Candidatus Hydrothermarchaeales archaeon]